MSYRFSNITLDYIIHNASLTPLQALRCLKDILLEQNDRSLEYIKQFLKYMRWSIDFCNKNKHNIDGDYNASFYNCSYNTFLENFLCQTTFICCIYNYPIYFEQFLKMYCEIYSIDKLICTVKNYIIYEINELHKMEGYKFSNDYVLLERFKIENLTELTILSSFDMLLSLNINIDLNFIDNTIKPTLLLKDELDKTYIEYTKNYILFCLVNNYINMSYTKFIELLLYYKNFYSTYSI